MTMTVLNLYAGIGGNRKRWKNVKVTAIELNPKIAAIYREFHPDDLVLVCDAHAYLLEHFHDEEYDFIWSSPPCPTHSRLNKCYMFEKGIYRYPDMNLYQEILFLQNVRKKPWVVENVISYYDPLIKPYQYKEHYYWANFVISGKKHANREHDGGIEKLQDLKDFNLDGKTGIDKELVLRNCVEPEAGEYIMSCATTLRQKKIIEEEPCIL